MISVENRTALAARWRRRASEFDDYARSMRDAGDTREARDAEQAALGYRVAADDLEASEQ